MIARDLLEAWLERALRFANLPRGCSDAEADAAIRGTDPEAEADAQRRGIYLSDPIVAMPWHAPADGYGALHAAWRRGLTVLIARGAAPSVRRLLQQLCVYGAMDESGQAVFLTSSADTLPFGFDENGRPQLGFVHVTTPGALLAAVGAELISPDATFRVCQCKACGQFWALSLVKRPRHRARTEYCGRKECTPVSSPRVVEWRLNSKHPNAKKWRREHPKAFRALKARAHQE